VSDIATSGERRQRGDLVEAIRRFAQCVRARSPQVSFAEHVDHEKLRALGITLATELPERGGKS
jgi:hypothetical protein